MAKTVKQEALADLDYYVKALTRGRRYLTKEDFDKSIYHPRFHRPLPYTLADIQYQIEMTIAKGHNPATLFNEVYATFPVEEWLTIVNFTIIGAIEKQKQRSAAHAARKGA